VVAALVASLAGAATYAGQQPPHMRTDFDALLVAGHAWTTGHDAYAAARAYGAHPPGYPLLYPAPAILFTAPVTAFRRDVALALWTGLGVGLLAYAMTRRTWWGLLALAWPFTLHAYFSAQWSPLLTASASLPWLGLAWGAKPSIGVPLFAAYPNRWIALAGVVLTAISFVAFPGWTADWRAAIQATHHLIPLILRPGGWVLLIAWLRWRRPEGRLLGTMAIVPHTAMPYHFLILALLLRTRAEWVIGTGLAWASYVAVRTWGWIPPAHHHDESIAAAWPFWLALCYIPALILVLARRNEGGES